MRTDVAPLPGKATGRLWRRLEHRRVERLLPWLINETLEGGERRLVERHLGTCGACRRRLAAERRLATLLGDRRLPSVAPHPAKLGALLERIEATPQARRPRRRWPLLPAGLFAPRAIWLVVGAQALALVLVATALFLDRWPERATPEIPYRTLSAPSDRHTGLNAAEPRLRIVFAPSVTEEEIRALLETLEGRMVDGPTRLGVYTVALPPGSAGDRLEAALDRLRKRPEILFAEPALGNR